MAGSTILGSSSLYDNIGHQTPSLPSNRQQTSRCWDSGIITVLLGGNAAYSVNRCICAYSYNHFGLLVVFLDWL